MSAQPPEVPDSNSLGAQLISQNIDVDQVRSYLLNAIKAAAENYVVQDDPAGKDVHGQAALQFAQSYLLIDPTLDKEGLPAEGPGSKAHAQAKAQHEFPPKVHPNAAMQASADKHKLQGEALEHDRGQTPRPSPRA